MRLDSYWFVAKTLEKDKCHLQITYLAGHFLLLVSRRRYTQAIGKYNEGQPSFLTISQGTENHGLYLIETEDKYRLVSVNCEERTRASRKQ